MTSDRLVSVVRSLPARFPQVRLLLAALLLAGGSAASAQDLTIAHDPVGCVVAERFPEIQARIDPAERVAEARVVFRPKGGALWYSVRMSPDAGGFRALLPRPKRDLSSFDYYVEAAGRELSTVRTEEFSPVVAADAVGCQARTVAAGTATGTVALQVPAGAPPIPAGFAATGVVAAAAGVAGAAAGTAAAGATAGGGGVSTGLLVAGGVLAAGGAAAAAVVVASGDDSETIITGFVYLGECTCAANGPPPYGWLTVGPLQGAVISTALDATTATTDATGRFELRTATPAGAPSSFEGRATAPGCSSSTWTASSGDNRGDIHLTLTCTNGPPLARSCNCRS